LDAGAVADCCFCGARSRVDACAACPVGRCPLNFERRFVLVRFHARIRGYASVHGEDWVAKRGADDVENRDEEPRGDAGVLLRLYGFVVDEDASDVLSCAAVWGGGSNDKRRFELLFRRCEVVHVRRWAIDKCGQVVDPRRRLSNEGDRLSTRVYELELAVDELSTRVYELELAVDELSTVECDLSRLVYELELNAEVVPEPAEFSDGGDELGGDADLRAHLLLSHAGNLATQSDDLVAQSVDLAAHAAHLVANAL
jgi:hypothetical protein